MQGKLNLNEENPTMELRDYQHDIIQEIREHATRTGDKKLLVVAPTGAGKTIIAAAIMGYCAENNNPVLFLAHRRELIFQCRDKLRKFGLDCGVIMAGEIPDHQELIQVASIQTLHSQKKRLGEYFLPPASLIVIDEAHRSLSKSYLALIEHYEEQKAIALGLTATPIRGDGKGLGHVWQYMAKCPDIGKLTDMGFLVPVRYFAPSKPDLEGIKITAGDYNAKELEVKMDNIELIGDVVENWVELAENRTTVVFASGVKHSIHIAEAFRMAGIPAEHIDGKTPKDEREAILGRLESGETRIVSNCMVLCLDSETEILTDRGWMGHDKIKPSDRVANWDQGKVKFIKPKEIITRPRGKGERMVVLKTPRRDLRVTEGHWMLYRTKIGGRWLKKQARDLVGKAVKFPVSGFSEPFNVVPDQEFDIGRNQTRLLVNSTSYNCRKREGMEHSESIIEATRRTSRKYSLRTKKPKELSLDECRFIGFWVGDGTRGKLIRGGVEYKVAQSKVYPEIIKWFDGVIARCGFDFLKKEKAVPVDHFIWSFGRGTGGGSQQRNGLFPIEKYLDKNGSKLLRGLDSKQFQAFIEGLWLADGNHGQGGMMLKSIIIHSVNTTLLSLIQEIACVRGWGVSLYPGKKSVKSWHKQIYVIGMTQNQEEHIMSRNRFEFEDGWKEELVWCVKTETRNIITRRNGRIAVMGNTEGWDMPIVSCAVLARPTRNPGLYIQMGGRILRPHEGKKDALLIDHAGSVWDHGKLSEFTEWELDMKGSLRDRVETRIREKGRDLVCSKCTAIYSGRKSCPECGHEPKNFGKAVIYKDGRLFEIGTEDLDIAPKNWTKEIKQQWYSEIFGYAQSRGYAEGWTSHTYKAKFGVWPRMMKNVALTPGREVKAHIVKKLMAFKESRPSAYTPPPKPEPQKEGDLGVSFA